MRLNAKQEKKRKPEDAAVGCSTVMPRYGGSDEPHRAPGPGITVLQTSEMDNDQSLSQDFPR